MQRILVGYDGSDPSRRALQRACGLLHAGGILAVINVIDLLPAGVRPGQDSEPVAREEQGRLLAQAEALAAEQGCGSIRRLAERGDPGRLIARRASEMDADLVVVGTRGLGAAGRLVLGSVSDAVVRHADRDILLVR